MDVNFKKALLITLSTFITIILLIILFSDQPAVLFIDNDQFKEKQINEISIFEKNDVYLRDISSSTYPQWGIFSQDRLIGDTVNSEPDITVIINIDPDCEVCSRFNNRVLPRVLERFRNESVMFGYRMLPQDEPITEVLHPYAYEKTKFALCIGEEVGKDKQYDYINELFVDTAIDAQGAATLANEYLLPSVTVNDCLSRNSVDTDYLLPLAQATFSAGIRSIPAVVIVDNKTGFRAEILNDEVSVSQAINKLLRGNL